MTVPITADATSYQAFWQTWLWRGVGLWLIVNGVEIGLAILILRALRK